MSAERRETEPVRELRLEGVALLVIGGLLVAGLAGAFYLGRWYERRSQPTVSGVDTVDPLAHVVGAGEQPPADVADGANYFDTVEGGEKEAEPARELAPAAAQPPPAAESKPASPALAGVSTTVDGEYWVQVFAGRDESAAAGLVSKLESAGHRVRLHTQPEGQGARYKVRVGGYQTRDIARNAAQQLQDQGYAGAWVTHVE